MQGEQGTFDVAVSFYGPDFVLTVLWTTDSTTPDQVRAEAAARWFEDTYGFDPSEHAERVDIAAMPPSARAT